jgi:hypothetical protein
MTPGAALIKATLMASAIRVPRWISPTGLVQTGALPSYEQGFGFPVLDNALYFAGDERTLFADQRDGEQALGEGDIARFHFDVSSTQSLKVALAWTDPPGDPTSSSSESKLMNDLDLVVRAPDGSIRYGNESLHPGEPDRRNNAELVDVSQPDAGAWTVEVSAAEIRSGLAQGFALVVVGDTVPRTAPRRRPVRR